MEKNSGGGGHRASRGKMTFVNCDGIVEETMRAYKGNFIRRSGRVNDYFVSKAIDSMAKKPAKLEIMARK